MDQPENMGRFSEVREGRGNSRGRYGTEHSETKQLVPLMIVNIGRLKGKGGDYPNHKQLLETFRFEMLYGSRGCDIPFTERRWINNLDEIEAFPEVVKMLQDYRIGLEKVTIGRLNGATQEKRKILRDYCAARTIYSLVFKVDEPIDQIEDLMALDRIHQPVKRKLLVSSRKHPFMAKEKDSQRC